MKPVDEDVVRVVDRDSIRWVTINRPEVRNALNAATWSGLLRAVSETESMRDIRALVLTGAGKAFSSGGDLSTAYTHAGPGVHGQSSRLMQAHDVVLALTECRVPTIAAVDGPALGVGWSLALACDIAFFGPTSWFRAPFIERGIVPDGGLLWLLTQSVGRHRALEIFLAGDRISPQDASAMGLGAYVPERTALDAASSFAARIAGGPTETITLTKRIAQQVTLRSLREYLRLELDASTLNKTTRNPQEGVTAWRESRRPVFE